MSIGEMVKQFARTDLDTELATNLDPSFLVNYMGDYSSITPSMIGFHTAFNNDDNSKFGFAQQVIAFGKPDDILLGISTSGNSENVINAIKLPMPLARPWVLLVLMEEDCRRLRTYPSMPRQRMWQGFRNYTCQYTMPFVHSLRTKFFPKY